MIDQHTLEARATDTRWRFSAHAVIEALNGLPSSHRSSAVIHIDNETEFLSRAIDPSAYREDMKLDFSHPEPPTSSTQVTSLNSLLRAKCVDALLLESLKNAEETLTSWRTDQNAVRPHGALRMPIPRESAEISRGNPGH